jgi:hypothetical protein
MWSAHSAVEPRYPQIRGIIMQREAAPFTESLRENATRAALERVRRLGGALRDDAQRTDRLAQQQCQPCFYQVRMGAAAITTRPCGHCGQSQSYGSSSTDVLCMKCAVDHSACRHCGADLASVDSGAPARP